MRVISNPTPAPISPLIPHTAAPFMLEKAREAMRQARTERNAAGLLAAFTAESIYGEFRMRREALEARTVRLETRIGLSLEQIFQTLDPKIKKLARILDYDPAPGEIAVLRPKLADVSAKFLNIVLKDAGGIFQSEAVLAVQRFLDKIEAKDWKTLDLTALDALPLSAEGKAGLDLIHAWTHAEACRLTEARDKLQDVIVFLATSPSPRETSRKLESITATRGWLLARFWAGR